MSSYMDTICDDLPQDCLSEWNSTSPDIPMCYQLTILPIVALIHTIFVCIPHVIALNFLKTPARPFYALTIAKLVVISLLFVVYISDLIGSTVLYSKDAIPVAFLIWPGLLTIAMLVMAGIVVMERMKNAPNSGPYFTFWLLMAILVLLRFRSVIKTAVEMGTVEDTLHFSLIMIQFPAVLASLVLAAFSDRTTPPAELGALPPCPEMNASFLSRIIWWWFNDLLLKGYKKPLAAEDLWDINEFEKSKAITPPLIENLEKSLRIGAYAVVVPDDRPRRYSQDPRLSLVGARKASAGVGLGGSVPVEENGDSLERASGEKAGDNLPMKPLLTEEEKTAAQGEDTPAVEVHAPRGLWSRICCCFCCADKTKDYKPAPDGGSKEQSGSDCAFVAALSRTYGGVFLLSSLYKLCTDLLLFAGPLLLKALVNFVADRSQPSWRGYLYGVAMFLCALIQSLFLHQYFDIVTRLGMTVRAALVSAIYRKSLRLSNAARRESTVGEIVNLMSVDAQKFLELMTYLNMMWSGPLQIIIALVFLYKELGPSVFAGVTIMILLLPINAGISMIARRLQMRQMKHKDSRIKLMSEILNGIKVLKLYAWEPSFIEQVSNVRQKELTVLRHTAYLNAATTFTWNCAPFLVSLATFGVYTQVSSSNVLDAEKAFVSLSLFNILRFPLLMFPMVITNVVQASVSVKRLSVFFRRHEISPNAVHHEDTPGVTAVLEHATCAWDVDGDPVLMSVTVNFPEGQLTGIVGPVGCGKSSMLSALLGEMEILGGRINTKGSIAYVPQQAWIMNATLRDNILFNTPYDCTRYQRVLEACALTEDLSVLSDGDMTEIGEKGINLSGGQKQRVSLARACYSNAEVFLLDDPLSAVDSYVGKHLMEKVIGPRGMLAGKTRILVTHNVTALPQCDRIVVLNGGRVSEAGAYRQLINHAGAFADFIATHLVQEATEGDLDEEDQAEKQRILNDLEKAFSRSDHCSPALERLKSIDSGKRTTPSTSVHASENQLNHVDSPKKTKKLIEDEKTQVGNVKFGVYLTYLRAVGLPFCVAILLLYILNHSASLGSNLWLADWSEDSERLRNISHTWRGPNATKPPAWVVQQRDLRVGVYGALGFIQALFSLVGHFVTAFGYLRASSLLHGTMLYYVLRSPMSMFDTVPSGRILNRFSSDITVVDMALPNNFSTFIMMMMQILSTLIAIILPDQWIILPLILVGVIYCFLQRFYVSTSRQLKRLESVSRSPIYSHFGETLQGVSSIRAYSQTETFIALTDDKVDKNVATYAPNISSNRWLAVRLEFTGNIIVLLAGIFACVSRDAGTVSAGLAGLSITYALNVTQTLNWMVRISAELESNIVSVERIKEYSELEAEASWEIPDSKPPSEWPTKGEIEFRNYSSRYRPGLDLVLQDVSFSVNPNERVAIVGRTGSGKSSLVLSLFRVIEPAQGSIYLDNVDLSTVGLHDVRSRLTIIPQDPVLFSGTLRVNLDPFDRHDDSVLWSVLTHANLKSFVEESSPTEGLSMMVAEGGENLSVGQRQLVCLARALLRHSRVLVLDEATAAVDLDTDALIQKTIREEFAHATVITIAHRLHTIMDYDRVLVMDAGRVAEYDTPDALLAQPNSIFAGLAHEAKVNTPNTADS